MDRISQISEKLDQMESMIYGREGPGLKDTVVRLSETVKHLDGTTESLKTAVSGLVRFMDETRGKDKIKTQMASTIKWLIGSLVTLIIALVTILITIYMK